MNLMFKIIIFQILFTITFSCYPGCFNCFNLICKQCNPSYYLSNGNCTACLDSQCEICNNGVSECTKCLPGYTVNQTKCYKTCINCNSGDDSKVFTLIIVFSIIGGIVILSVIILI